MYAYAYPILISLSCIDRIETQLLDISISINLKPFILQIPNPTRKVNPERL
jgi:hypothetical protein